jgi:hypothetical protein
MFMGAEIGMLIVETIARGVARLVGNEGGVVSGVINLESSGVEAPNWRPRHDKYYHEASFFAACSRDGCCSTIGLTRSKLASAIEFGNSSMP